LAKYAKNGSIKCIAETDINLLVKVLKTAQVTIEYLKSERQKIAAEIEDTRR